MVSSTPWPHFTPGKDPVPISQEAGWAPGPVQSGGKSRPHWDSIPDRPARSSVATPTELPGPTNVPNKPFKKEEMLKYLNMTLSNGITTVKNLECKSLKTVGELSKGFF